MPPFIPEWGILGMAAAILTLLVRNNTQDRRDARLLADAAEKRHQQEVSRSTRTREQQLESLLKRVSALEVRVDKLEAELRKERMALLSAERELASLRGYN